MRWGQWAAFAQQFHGVGQQFGVKIGAEAARHPIQIVEEAPSDPDALHA